jgi:hypothetical protein
MITVTSLQSGKSGKNSVTAPVFNRFIPRFIPSFGDSWGGEVRRFHDPARPHLHPEDLDISLDIGRYDFAVRVEFENARPVARIETPTVTIPRSPT